MWRGPHYRTQDKVIPFRLFWIHYRGMASVQALERIQFTRAVASAIGTVFGKADSGLPESLRRDLRDAYLDGG